ncbi:MAG: NUDIX domain-containing protein [Planctomycetota bacterium]
MQQRRSARAILLNARDQVLLIQHADAIPVDPVRPDVRCYWATPGGGIQAGEQPIAALRRELQEELGLTNVVIGRRVGVREVPLNLPEAGLVLSHETYFVCRISEDPQFNPAGMSDSERQTLKTIRWWSREALHITKAILRPGALPNIIEHALHADSEPVFIRD